MSFSNDYDELAWTRPQRDTKKVAIVAGLIAVVIIAGIVVGPYAYFYILSSSHPSCLAKSSTPASGFGVGTGSCVNLGVTITYQQDTFPRLSMLEQGYNPSCWFLCDGITYSEG